jgi:serine O-acetyltransferase
MPYGTPCGEDCEPLPTRIGELEQELQALRSELNALKLTLQPRPKAKSA